MTYLVPSHIHLGEAAFTYLCTKGKVTDLGAAVLSVAPRGRGLSGFRHGDQEDARQGGISR
jgi:hypothetical protein